MDFYAGMEPFHELHFGQRQGDPAHVARGIAGVRRVCAAECRARDQHADGLWNTVARKSVPSDSKPQRWHSSTRALDRAASDGDADRLRDGADERPRSQRDQGPEQHAALADEVT